MGPWGCVGALCQVGCSRSHDLKVLWLRSWEREIKDAAGQGGPLGNSGVFVMGQCCLQEGAEGMVWPRSVSSHGGRMRCVCV